MHKERDSRGRFIARGRSSIPTTPPTPPRTRSDTTTHQAHTPSHRTPNITGVEIQSKESLTSSTKAVLDEKNLGSLTVGVAFFTSTGEHILVEELGIPSEEEEFEPLSHISLIGELKEDKVTLQVEPYTDSKETIMAEGEDGEFTLFGGGGRGRGRVNNGGGIGNREIDNYFGYPIVDEEKNATMKNISSSVLPNFHGLKCEDPETFLFEFEVLCRTHDYLEDSQKLMLFPSTLKGVASN